jgi:S-layer homology domain
VRSLTHSTASLLCAAALLLPLASCANSSFGDAAQRSLAADPKLKDAAPNGMLAGLDEVSSPAPSPSPSAPLETQLSGGGTTGTPTDGGTTEPSPTAQPTAQPTSTPALGQELNLGLSGTSAGKSSGVTEPSPNPANPAPRDAGNPSIATNFEPNRFADLDKTPKELKSAVTDLAQLGVLNGSPASKAKAATGPDNFLPNKPIARRDYVRWLFAANNRLFSDRPAQQIRPADSANAPAFRDVPATDPDFPIIQGLAEAGILPSSLSGDPTAITFRPEAQLSRETLLMWKVPVDLRQSLPTATLDAIKQTWGFQDSAQIAPNAYRAILADHQNGDLANIRRVFGYTTIFQPKKAVTRAEAAATLWYFGYQGDGRSAQEALKKGT